MMNRSYLAFLVVFGACGTDHQLGLIAPADSGVDDSNTVPFSPDAASSVQVEPDALAYLVPETSGIVLPVSSSSPDARVIGQLGPIQSWTGYVENYQFPSGSDSIKLTFATDSTGQVMGTVLLGEGTPPSPATDPNAGYPPGFAAMNTYTSGYWVEGFAYSMVSAAASSSRLRFAVQSNELWSGWCALQIPVDGGGMCVPNWGAACVDGQCSQTNPANGQTISVDRGKFELCFMSHVCFCSTTACAADLPGGGTPSFDIAISGTSATGSTTAFMGSQNVHLTRDP